MSGAPSTPNGALVAVLDKIEDYLEQRQDVRDGSDRVQLPNEEMLLLMELAEARTAWARASLRSETREKIAAPQGQSGGRLPAEPLSGAGSPGTPSGESPCGAAPSAASAEGGKTPRTDGLLARCNPGHTAALLVDHARQLERELESERNRAGELFMLALERGEKLSARSSAPVAMLLFCPRCRMQHVDEPKGDWTNPPHATHTCQHCGLLWRPSNENTTGVLSIPAAEEKHLDRINACFLQSATGGTDIFKAALRDIMAPFNGRTVEELQTADVMVIWKEVVLAMKKHIPALRLVSAPDSRRDGQ